MSEEEATEEAILQVRVKRCWKAALEEQSKRIGVPMSSIVKMAVEEFLRNYPKN